PDPAASQRFVAKTTDGGRTWAEIPLVDDAKVREFGVAFVDADTGWVGAMPHGFATTDGGKTWAKTDFGNAVNKIRLLRGPEGVTGYAIGVEVHRLRLGKR
ncbi:MAG: WD40/YVTN/BNR-like repeat-containing protein, partial [bacterium]